MKGKNLVIETIYGKEDSSNVYVRSTDGKMLDKVNNSPIREKRYFLNNNCIYSEKSFNKDIIYTINNINNNEIIRCNNCGHEDRIENFNNGCPYCKTSYNIGINKTNGASITNEAVISNKSVFRIICEAFLLIFIAILVPVSLGSMLLSNTLQDFLFFFTTIIISVFIIIYMYKYRKVFNKKIKDKNGNYSEVLQERYRLEADGYVLKNFPWLISKNEKDFYSSLNNNLLSMLFATKKDLIDYDYLSFDSLDFLSDELVKVNCTIREVYYNNGMTSIYNKYEITMKYNDINNNNTYKEIKCPGCGASIDINKNKCDYCSRVVSSNTLWNITNFIKK